MTNCVLVLAGIVRSYIHRLIFGINQFLIHLVSLIPISFLLICFIFCIIVIFCIIYFISCIIIENLYSPPIVVVVVVIK